MGEVFFTGESRDASAEVPLPNGVFQFFARLEPLKDPEGRVESVIALVSDVTERLQAQKLESLGLLAGGIAHDFNNLLAGILGNSELALADVDEDSPARPALEDIQHSAERAAELTQRLVSYAGTGPEKRERVAFGDIAKEMLQLLRAGTRSKLRLEFLDDGGRSFVDADTTQLRQVVMNLVSNAMEAVDENGGTLVLRTGVVDLDPAEVSGLALGHDVAPGTFSFLDVEDDGCGIEPAALERIFDPFFTTKFDGRGLGLAAVLGIVRSHGGLLAVESTVGEGTRFSVYLPFAAN